MGSKDAIIKLRKENPLMNLVQIGQEVGTSKQYVHKILKRAGLATSVPRPRKFHACKECDEIIFNTMSRNSFCSDNCHYKYYQIEVACSFCHMPFMRSRGSIVQSHRRKFDKIYCSVSCKRRGLKEIDTPEARKSQGRAGRQKYSRIDYKEIYRQEQEELVTFNAIEWD